MNKRIPYNLDSGLSYHHEIISTKIKPRNFKGPSKKCIGHTEILIWKLSLKLLKWSLIPLEIRITINSKNKNSYMYKISKYF